MIEINAYDLDVRKVVNALERMLQCNAVGAK